MKRQLAFVLGGGGARGALQVGALRALLEAKFTPNILVGTSIGAVNATVLAVWGASLETIDTLIADWRDATLADLMPSNYLWLTLRSLFNRPGGNAYQRTRSFLISHGLSPEMRFKDIKGMRLILVSADLNSGQPVFYGTDPDQSILEGVLASIALPPWMRPFQRDGKYLIDGGVVSNLPIEAALSQGATDLIALELSDPRSLLVEYPTITQFMLKLFNLVEQRQIKLELDLAAARHANVRLIYLYGKEPVDIWDFRRTEELIARGYEITCQEIKGWQEASRPGWRTRLAQLRTHLRW